MRPHRRVSSWETGTAIFRRRRQICTSISCSLASSTAKCRTSTISPPGGRDGFTATHLARARDARPRVSGRNGHASPQEVYPLIRRGHRPPTRRTEITRFLRPEASFGGSILSYRGLARWERAHRLLLRRRRSLGGRRFARHDRFHPSFLEYIHQPLGDVSVLPILQQPGGESEAVWRRASAATTTTAPGTCRSRRAASACGVVGAAPAWI